MALRAYGREDKAARRKAILDAAATLFMDGGGELPSVAQIASQAGLAKGTIYLYFASKEALFSTLLLDLWGEVFDVMEVAFASGRRAGPAQPVDAFLDGLTAHIADHPEMLRLDALSLGVLKANLSPQERQAFTSAYDKRLAAGAALLDRALDLSHGRGVQLLLRTYGLTRGLWRSLEELDTTQASLRPVGPFIAELREALAEYWRGALRT